MEVSPRFSPPHQESDATNFELDTKLYGHLDQYAKIAEQLGAKMTPIMQAVCQLTNKAALRSAATFPQEN